MATIIILVVILACVVQQVFFGSIVRSFAILISAIIGAFIAMNFFELAAQQLIANDFMTWQAHGIALGLLFALSFGIMVGIAMKLLAGEVAFSKLIDKIGGAVIGVFTGLVISGIVVIALGLAFGSGTFPYERFPASASASDVKKPAGAYVDGFVAVFFGLVSNGSLAGQNSFEAVHASFNDTIALDRLAAEKKISPLAGKGAIQGSPLMWLAPAEIKDTDGKKLPENSGNDLVIVRLNMSKSVGKDTPNFMLGQLRLICRNKDAKGQPGEGAGTAVYPIGYMKPTGLFMAPLSTQITFADVKKESSSKTVDFAFYIPAGMKPSLIEYKRNMVMPAPSMSDAMAAEAKNVPPAATPEKPANAKPAPVTDANSN
jgi:hypothetical protein